MGSTGRPNRRVGQCSVIGCKEKRDRRLGSMGNELGHIETRRPTLNHLFEIDPASGQEKFSERDRGSLALT